MLVQSPSQIFKSDFSVWRKENSCLINTIISSKKDSELRNVTEIVLDENGNYYSDYKENCSILIIVLYGSILINDLEKPVSANQIFTLKSCESGFFLIKNTISNEKADILIFELHSKEPESFFSIENLNLSEKNTLIPISENLGIPNFIGLYDGRKEQEYILYQKKSIFGMVINGAFEFQNRLMETRDAILLQEIELLEFEALSENALLIFLEV